MCIWMQPWGVPIGIGARDILYIENFCSVVQKKVLIQEPTPRSQSLNYSMQRWIILDEHRASSPFPMSRWERMEWKARDMALSMLLLACYENRKCIESWPRIGTYDFFFFFFYLFIFFNSFIDFFNCQKQCQNKKNIRAKKPHQTVLQYNMEQKQVN